MSSQQSNQQPYKQIDVKPMTGVLGAEIEGVNLGETLSGDVVGEIRAALLEHLVIFFRGQDLTPEKQIAFARRFGTLDTHEFVAGMAEYPELIVIVKAAEDDGYNFGGRWHSDVTYQENPALGSILYGVEIPPHGGDTLFANQQLAYEALSAGMRKMLDGMNALHSAASAYGLNGRATHADKGYTKEMRISASEEAEQRRAHPVVRTHPESGRKGLFVNEVYTERFEDMTVEESRPLLEYLFRHATRDDFTCRFRWETGSVAFWDNRCVQHFALNDYLGYRRVMHRATIAGDQPRNH